jgi:hypothetical protein
MIHPETKLKWVSTEIGYGVFATQPIPKGTAVYVRDALEIVVPKHSGLAHNAAYAEILRKYSYIDAKGDYILSWDHGRYVNHCCHPNTITTGYGFEIAIRDIAPGEEITDDYGLLNLDEDIPLACDKANCRLVARARDFDTYAAHWDTVVRQALTSFNLVDQPLLPFFESKTLDALKHYLSTGKDYQSVLTQKYQGPEGLPKMDSLLAAMSSRGLQCSAVD